MLALVQHVDVSFLSITFKGLQTEKGKELGKYFLQLTTDRPWQDHKKEDLVKSILS